MSGPKPPSAFPQQLSLAQMPGGEDFVKANKPTADHRYPRGFTPPRLHEVAEAMPEEHFNVGMQRTGPGLYKPSSGYFTDPTQHEGPQQEVPGGGDQFADTSLAAGKRFRARAVDVVARSTAPVEDVEGLHFFAHHEANARAAGTYSRPWEEPTTHQMSNPLVTMYPTSASGERGEATLMHEIGHHADYRQDPRMFNRRLITEMTARSASPNLEGYAEGYMSGHHVPRPGNEPAHRNYDEQFGSNMNYLNRRFEGSGGKVKHEEISGKPPRVPTGSSATQEGYMKDPSGGAGLVRRQDLLWRRNVSQFDTSTERDFGQWPIETHEGEEMSTIRSGAGVPELIQHRLRPEIKPSLHWRARQMMDAEEPGLRINSDQALGVARGEIDPDAVHWMPRTPAQPAPLRNAHTHWR